MSKTLLMIIEPAALMADEARRNQERYLREIRHRPPPMPTTIELKAVSDRQLSLAQYALTLVTIYSAFGLSVWLLVVLLQQLLGVRPLW